MLQWVACKSVHHHERVLAPVLPGSSARLRRPSALGLHAERGPRVMVGLMSSLTRGFLHMWIS